MSNENLRTYIDMVDETNISEDSGASFLGMLTYASASKILKEILVKVALPRLSVFVPGFGLAAGLYFAVHSLARTDKSGKWDPDWVGAGLETGIGAAGGSVIANAGAWAGIVYIVYREFYAKVNDGNYPVEHAFGDDYNAAESFAQTNELFGFVWDTANNWLKETFNIAHDDIEKDVTTASAGMSDKDKAATVVYNHLTKVA